MVLKAFWGSLGLLLGALGALLGVSWELLRASGSTKEGLQIRLGTLLGLVCSLLAAEDGLGNVLGPHFNRFGCSRSNLNAFLASVKTVSTIKTAFRASIPYFLLLLLLFTELFLMRLTLAMLPDPSQH